jgi:zinc protease
VTGLDGARVKGDLERMLAPARAAFVFAGDLDPHALQAALEARFGSWKTAAGNASAPLPPLVQPAPGRIVLVHRANAPQTVIQILRPVPAAEGKERAVRAAVDTVFGGTFTSRLNANLREDKGWTYGASSRVLQEGKQFLLRAGAAVVTVHTGDALKEFQKEFGRMAAGLSAEELQKAVESNRQRLTETAETTAGLARFLSELVRNGRALDAFRTDLAALDAVDLTAAGALAGSGLYDWNDCLVVLVGDRAQITSQLAAAGFAAPAEVDALGAPQP